MVIVMAVSVRGCALRETVEQVRAGYRRRDGRGRENRQETVLAVFLFSSTHLEGWGKKGKGIMATGLGKLQGRWLHG